MASTSKSLCTHPRRLPLRCQADSSKVGHRSLAQVPSVVYHIHSDGRASTSHILSTLRYILSGTSHTLFLYIFSRGPLLQHSFYTSISISYISYNSLQERPSRIEVTRDSRMQKLASGIRDRGDARDPVPGSPRADLSAFIAV